VAVAGASVRARALTALAVGLLVLGVVGLRASRARADADPASDTLLVQSVFYPYSPATPPALQHALGRAVDELHAAGLPLKVAIIGSPVDLGGIPQLFGQVDRYAAFLDTEISFKGPQPLLVVMPDGLASQRAGAPGALAGIHVDAHDGSAGLARTAVAAVERIGAAEGHPIAAVATAAGSGGSGGGAAVVIAIAATALLLIAGGTGARSVRRRAVLHSPGGKS
jgi:hypothetical protein